MPRNGLELHYEVVEDICTLRCIFIGTHILRKGRPGRRYHKFKRSRGMEILESILSVTCEDSSADTVICRVSRKFGSKHSYLYGLLSWSIEPYLVGAFAVVESRYKG
jgi:hypothetical protein